MTHKELTHNIFY